MVKTILGVNHQGLTGWMIQRLSAVLMAIYAIGIFVFLVMHQPLNFVDWHMLFTNNLMKITTMLVLVSLLFHAWVGMWTVFSDYIKLFVLRFILHVATLIVLAAYFFWALEILWGI